MSLFRIGSALVAGALLLASASVARANDNGLLFHMSADSSLTGGTGWRRPRSQLRRQVQYR